MPDRGQVVAVIFARGGSKGIPKKNLQRVEGRTLVAHAIATAQSCPSIDRTVVSTDDDEIAAEARREGADVPFLRPVELAKDETPEWLAWRHAVDALEAAGPAPIDLLVSLPPTSPLRVPEDVEACIDLARQTDADIVITVTPSRRHPSFNMVGLDAERGAHLLMPPQSPIARRQDTLPAFDVTTVAYVVRPGYVRSASWAFQGNVRAHVIPEARALDVDTELDLRVARCLMESRVSEDQS